jgi:siroheme synthase-like protein
MSVMIELQASAGPVLVVGGGTVATRKVSQLVEGGFRVTVIAPAVTRAIRELPGVTLVEAPFEPADIPSDAPYVLVFACTDDREVNRRVGELARRASILVVVADAQEESTFFTPATLHDGALTVGVSTGGASPALARELRERIAAALGTGWGEKVEAARRDRSQSRSTPPDTGGGRAS